MSSQEQDKSLSSETPPEEEAGENALRPSSNPPPGDGFEPEASLAPRAGEEARTADAGEDQEQAPGGPSRGFLRNLQTRCRQRVKGGLAALWICLGGLRKSFVGLPARARLPRRLELLFVGLGVVLALGAGLLVAGIVQPLQQSSGKPSSSQGTPAQEETAAPGQEELLEPAEYLKLGKGAIAAADFTRAARLLEIGLSLSDPNDHQIRASFFALLGRIGRRQGQPLRERILVENSERLSVRAQAAVSLLEEALAELRSKQFLRARRDFAAFLLRQGELDAATRERLVSRAVRQLGQAAWEEWRSKLIEPLDIVGVPALAFEDKP